MQHNVEMYLLDISNSIDSVYEYLGSLISLPSPPWKTFQTEL